MKPAAAALPDMADPHLKAEPRSWGAMQDGRPIDLVHLSRQTFGDKRLETELLRLFMRQSDQIQKSLEPMADGEAQAVPSMELLHMLSGSARVIGATDVAAMAGGIEADMRRGTRGELNQAERQCLSRLIERTTRYIADLLDQG